MAIFVVGSGPAGVSAAYSLLRKGFTVTMLDVGFRLELERQQVVDRLAAGMPETWDEKNLDDLRSSTKASVGRLPQKLVYGSDFPYRAPTNWFSSTSAAATC
jgi:flavin-dependent dehydrogenase